MVKWKDWFWIPVICSVLFLQFGEDYWSQHWYSKWGILMYAAIAFYTWHIGSKVSWWVAPIFGVALTSAAYVSFWGGFGYPQTTNSVTFLAINKNALYAACIVLSVGLVWANFKKSWIKPITYGLAVVCLSSILVTIHAKKSWAANFGFFSGNASMNGGLIACLLPFLLTVISDHWGPYMSLQKYWYQKHMGKVMVLAIILAIWAIHWTNTRVPIGVLGVMFMAWIYASERSKILSGLLGAIIGLAGYLWTPRNFLDSDGRFQAWETMIKWWWAHCSHWFGSGLGSGFVLFPQAQILTQTTNYGLFIWMHNEWLQVYLELGIVGIITAFLAWAFFAVKALKQPALFSSFMAFSAFAVFDYPCRLPIHALSMVLIAGMILVWEPCSKPSGGSVLQSH